MYTNPTIMLIICAMGIVCVKWGLGIRLRTVISIDVARLCKSTEVSNKKPCSLWLASVFAISHFWDRNHGERVYFCFILFCFCFVCLFFRPTSQHQKKCYLSRTSKWRTWVLAGKKYPSRPPWKGWVFNHHIRLKFMISYKDAKLKKK